jgi:hypothetical protein
MYEEYINITLIVLILVFARVAFPTLEVIYRDNVCIILQDVKCRKERERERERE